MKTTEIFVEQVLIGLLVLATGLLPYIKWDQINTGWSAISIGGGIVAVAYLLGIVLDRFADTILSRPEQYYRLQFAIDLKEGKKENLKQLNLKLNDPFPEDNIVVKILKNSGSASDRMEYLRSRIRLSRAIAVFVPALTLSGLLTLGREQVNISCYLEPPVIMGVTALIYVLSFFFVWKISKLDSWKLPKTWNVNKRKLGKKFSWKWEPTIIAAGLLFSMTVFVAIYFICKEYSTTSKTCAVLLTGLGTTALSARAWWRINQTYMKFLNSWETSGRGEQ